MEFQSDQNEKTQPKKPYSAPELIEHGTIEDITGFNDDSSCTGSGCSD